MDEEVSIDKAALQAWEAPEPPEGFATSVMEAWSEQPQRQPKRWWLAVAAAVLLAAGTWWTLRTERGELHAAQRSTQHVGSVVMVAESGAELAWDLGRRGGEIEQQAGEVFYRVDESDVEVITPFGRIDVEGTCFRVALSDAAEENPMLSKTNVALSSAGMPARRGAYGNRL